MQRGRTVDLNRQERYTTRQLITISIYNYSGQTSNFNYHRCNESISDRILELVLKEYFPYQ